MSCPYFVPTERFDDAGFAHPQRLPLGAGFRGYCCSPGFDGKIPTDEELKSACNLGYAKSCSRLPEQRNADALRFSVLRDRDGIVSICYVAELNYLPSESGNLHFDTAKKTWSKSHPNVNLQTLAERFLQTYLERRQGK